MLTYFTNSSHFFLLNYPILDYNKFEWFDVYILYVWAFILIKLLIYDSLEAHNYSKNLLPIQKLFIWTDGKRVSNEILGTSKYGKINTISKYNQARSQHFILGKA